MNKHGKKFGASAVSAIAVLMSTSAAGAQSNAWTSSRSPADGTRTGAATTAAAAPSALASASCGAPGGSVIRTQNSPLETNSTAFVTVPGAITTVTVPAGTTRCIKVVFTGEAGCAGTSAPDFCYIRATDNNVEMNPSGGGFQAFSSEDSTAEAHAYEWVRRVGPGNHTIRIQGRVWNSNATFFLDDWTFDVQVLQ